MTGGDKVAGCHRGRGKDKTAAGRQRLTDDCIPSGDDAVQDAVKHDAMREQGGHDLAHHPAECSSCSREEALKEGNVSLGRKKSRRGQTIQLMLWSSFSE